MRRSVKGFSLFEALIAIGLLGIVIAMTLGIMSTMATVQARQGERKLFFEQLEAYAVKMGSRFTCEQVMAGFSGGANLSVETFSSARTIAQLRYPNEPGPFLVVNTPIPIGEQGGVGQLTFTELRLQLTVPLQKAGADVLQPNAMIWLDASYNFRGRNGTYLSGVKRVMYEVLLTSTPSTTGLVKLGSCIDYIARRNLEISQIFCTLMSMDFDPTPENGLDGKPLPKCDLSKSPDIKEATCRSIGGQFLREDVLTGDVDKDGIRGHYCLFAN